MGPVSSSRPLSDTVALTPRILIVEDEGVIALELRHHLREFGYEVVGTAFTGEQAIELEERTRPDLVLMDVVLRGRADGIDTAGVIRSKHNVPVVYLTAYNDEDTVARAAATAPYGYLSKPCGPRELRAAIETALHKHRLEQRLRENEQWFTKTLNCVADGIVATDPHTRVTFMNPTAERLTGWTLEEARGRQAVDVVRLIDGASGEARPAPMEAVLKADTVQRLGIDLRLERRDGRTVAVDERTAPIRDADGALLGAVTVLRDITDRKQLEEVLRASEEQFHKAFDHAAIGMALVTGEGEWIQLNPAMCRMLGTTEEEIRKRDWFAWTHDDDRPHALVAVQRVLAGIQERYEFERRYVTADGRVMWGLEAGSVVRSASNGPLHLVVQVQDITTRKLMEDELQRLARFDPLTGLANRVALGLRLEQSLATARRRRQRVALVFIDLDHFKRVNDTHGHDAGDELLREVARRLQRAVRESDTVARLGGDEFVVLLTEIGAIDDAVAAASKIRAALDAPIQVQQQAFVITASLGVSLAPDDGETVGTLLKHADTAMYCAKGNGRNSVAFYDAEMTARATRRLTREIQLRRALERHEFQVEFQPRLALATGRPSGTEALVRWYAGPVQVATPSEFIPLAEETGLIVPLGQWVLGEACQQSRDWMRRGVAGLTLSVNVSARQLRDREFVARVRKVIGESRIEPRLLELEITESLLVDESEYALSALRELRAIGVRIVVDDFGVGYSSLSYFRRFEPDVLKIDGSFVREVGGDRRDRAIVAAAIAMAHSLGLRVIAECVETPEQLRFLQDHGCDEIQGHLYSRPLSAEDAVRFLESQLR